MSESLAQQFKRQSFLIIKDFYPESIIENYRKFLQDSLMHEVEAVFRRLGSSLQDADCIAQIEKRMKDPDLSPSDKHILMGHFPLAVRLSQAIYPLAAFLGKSSLVREIIGSDHLFLHMPPMMRYVPPGYRPAAVPPHQDISYNRHMSEFITVWTPLVPITQTCGGLILYEGSGLDTHELADDRQDGDWLPPVRMGSWKKKQPDDLMPGDAVILSPYFVHESAPNTSDAIRLSMDLRVFGAHATSSKHCLDLTTMLTVQPVSSQQESV